MTGALIVLAFIAGMGATAFVMLLAAADTDWNMRQQETPEEWFEDVDQALLNVSERPVCRLRAVRHSKGHA